VSPNNTDTEASVAKCSRGLKIVPDVGLAPQGFGPDKYDAIIVPGGAQGAKTISENDWAKGLVKEYFEKGKVVGMICAGNFVARRLPASEESLKAYRHAGSLAAKTAGLPKQPITSHPSVKDELSQGE
jgi:protein DJ-1